MNPFNFNKFILSSVLALIGTLSLNAQTPPSYVVGSIPDQRVWFNEEGAGLTFDVTAEGLGATPTITASFDESQAPDGVLSFDPDLDRFHFNPAATDRGVIAITFLAVGSGIPIIQTVNIEAMQPLPPEQATFGIDPDPASLPDPEDDDYIIVDEARNPELLDFNDVEDRQTRLFKVIGKRIVLEEGHPNGLYEKLHDKTDIKELEIMARTVVIRDELHLPQTDVTIRAVDLIFEDKEGVAASMISTEPLQYLEGSNPARNGAMSKPEGGHTGGSLNLQVRSLEAPGDGVRFSTRGGKGRNARPSARGTSRGIRDALSRTIEGADTDTDYLLFLWIVKPTIFVKDSYYPDKANYNGSVGWGTELRDKDGNSTGGNGKPGSRPGDGGAGGDVASNIELGSLLDQGGGRSGDLATVGKGGEGARVRPKSGGGGLSQVAYRAKVTVDTSGNETGRSVHTFTSKDGKDSGVPAADVPIGSAGSFALLDDNLEWLSAEAMRLVLTYLNDAYLEGHLKVVSDELLEHLALFDEVEAMDAWQALSEETQDDLVQIRDDMRSLQHRIGSNMDFFGNPAGWVPMLSFEVNKLAFDNEIDRAMRIMYLNYWLGNRAQSVADQRDAMVNMRDELFGQIEADREELNDAVLQIPVVETDAANLQVGIDDAVREIRAIEQKLLPKAKNIVALKKTARTLGKIAQTIPVYQPALGTAGGAVAAAADIDPDKSWEENTLAVGEGAAGGFASGKALQKAQAAQAAAGSVNSEDPEGNDAAREAMKNARGPLLELLSDSYDVATATKGSNPEVEAELQRLLADVPEYRVVQGELEELNVEKREFITLLSTLIQKVTVLPIAISRNLRTIDLLNVEIDAANDRLDPATLAYLQDMEGRARARLLKYHYYVSRAYAYRRLEAYPGRLDLTSIVDEFRELSKPPEPSPADYDPDPTLTAEQFDSLKAVYEDQISSVAEAILNDVNQNPDEKSIDADIILSEDVIERLNQGEMVRINPKDLNLFPTSEENLRIVGLEVTSMEADYDPTGPIPSAFDLVIKHSGISELEKDGETYLFRHDNQNTRSRIQWKTRYQFGDGSLTPSSPSAASLSLISALVPNAVNVMKYSRPAAHADLMLSIDSSATPGARVELESATITLLYDYTESNQFLRTLELVEGSNGIDVQVELSEPDRNGRSVGRGGFERTFNLNKEITLTTPEFVGDLRFVRWEGGSFPNPTALSQTVTLTDNLRLEPIYEPRTIYTLTVIGGTGSGTYFPGDLVPIVANDPSSGQAFDGWTGGEVQDPSAATTMASVFDDTTITAQFTVVGNEAKLLIDRTNSSQFTLTLITQPGDPEAWNVESLDESGEWQLLTSFSFSDGVGTAVVPKDGPRQLYRAVSVDN